MTEKKLKQINLAEAIEILTDNPDGFVKIFRNGQWETRQAVFYKNSVGECQVIDCEDFISARELLNILTYRPLYTQQEN